MANITVYVTSSVTIAKYLVGLVINPKVSMTQIVNRMVYAASINSEVLLHPVK